MLYTVSSDKDLETVCTDLQQAAAGHQLGVLHVHNLKETMAKKGVEFGPECRIFEVCNPHQAKRVLERRLEIATALPCRIAVFVEGNRVKLSTVRPSALIGMFGQPDLEEVAREVEEAILGTMDEAA